MSSIVSRMQAAFAHRTVALAVAAVALAAGAGCVAEYQRTDVDAVVESPLGGTVNYAAVTVPEGMIVKAHIAPFNDDGNPLTCVLSSEDATVMDVSQAVGDKDYAFYGLKAGTTRINVRAGDSVVMVLDAIVTPQPPTTP
ncbi:MAG: hypothetical protein KC657_24445 [Myxococcales bacterium]|nr:hypothetical protein [Myxococcales bacterium]